MPKNTSFILGDHFDDFVNSQVEALRLALIEGEESGLSGPLDMQKIKKEARAEAALTPSRDASFPSA